MRNPEYHLDPKVVEPELIKLFNLDKWIINSYIVNPFELDTDKKRVSKDRPIDRNIKKQDRNPYDIMNYYLPRHSDKENVDCNFMCFCINHTKELKYKIRYLDIAVEVSTGQKKYEYAIKLVKCIIRLLSKGRDKKDIDDKQAYINIAIKTAIRFKVFQNDKNKKEREYIVKKVKGSLFHYNCIYEINICGFHELYKNKLISEKDIIKIQRSFYTKISPQKSNYRNEYHNITTIMYVLDKSPFPCTIPRKNIQKKEIDCLYYRSQTAPKNVQPFLLKEAAERAKKYNFNDKYSLLEKKSLGAIKNINWTVIRIKMKTKEQSLRCFKSQGALSKLRIAIYYFDNTPSLNSQPTNGNSNDSSIVNLISKKIITGNRSLGILDIHNSKSDFSKALRNISIEMKFFNPLIKLIRQTPNCIDVFLDEISKSEFVSSDTLNFFKNCFQKLLENDYISALTLLSVNFERYIREFLASQSINTVKINSEGSQQIISLSAFANDERVKKILGEHDCLLIELIYSSDYGLNLRNVTAHSLEGVKFYNSRNFNLGFLTLFHFVFKFNCINYEKSLQNLILTISKCKKLN